MLDNKKIGPASLQFTMHKSKKESKVKFENRVYNKTFANKCPQ